MIVANGTATFTTLGPEVVSFTWLDAITNAPVTFSAPPQIVFGPCQNVTSGGAGVPYLTPGSVTTTGGSCTCANPGTMTVGFTAIGT